MKKIILLFTAAVIATGSLLAQAATPQIPDFKNSPMLLKSDGTIEKLEKQSSEIKMKMNPYVGQTQFLNILGGKSPVRVRPTVNFIIKLADAETDPETVFYLTKTIDSKKNREIDMMKVSAWAGYGAKGKSVKKDQIQLNYEKVAPGVYKITPEKLLPGQEYAFVQIAQGASGAQSTVFLFGVD